MGGKAYANRRAEEKRPSGDYYPTPRSLMWVAETDVFGAWLDKSAPVLDPCCGSHVMADELVKFGYSVHENDIQMEGGVDYLSRGWEERQVVMNRKAELSFHPQQILLRNVARAGGGASVHAVCRLPDRAQGRRNVLRRGDGDRMVRVETRMEPASCDTTS